jgi:hypothetical protein
MQSWPPTIKVSPLGSTTAAADSRAVLRLPTSRKVLVAVLKTWAELLETVSVARLMMPPSLPPVSPPATRTLPASGPGVLVAVAVGLVVPVAVEVGVAVTVAVAVGVEVAVGVNVAVRVEVVVADAVDVAVAVGVAVLVEVEVAVAVAVAVGDAPVAVAVGVEVAVAVGVGVTPVLVAVGVGLAAVPNAVPVRVTVWVATCPLSSKVSLPVSAVPFGLLSVVGLNVTETWQLELAATDDPQEFAVMAYGALAVMELKVTATVFELESVTVCGAEVVSTWTLPNGSVFGDTVGVTTMPAPDSETVWVGVTALSVTTTVPVLVPF